MKRFSNTVSISIHNYIPDIVPYQVFLQIVFRFPEANAENLVVYRQPSDNGGVSYVIQGVRMNTALHNPVLHSNMLIEMGITTNDDENVLDFIDHYLPDFSIRYYTCESFIFTLINNAFQLSENLDHLIKLRLVVTDLHNLLRFKIGGLSPDNCTAHEMEILFSIGQVFRIRSIIQNEASQIWTVYLQVLHANETEHLNNLTGYYLSKIVGTETFYNGIQARVNFEPLTITTFVTIGNYYSSVLARNYDKAEFYYQKFLDEELESSDDFDFQNQPGFYYGGVYRLYYSAHSYINLQLARIRCEQKTYVEAAEYNQNAQKACLKISENAGQQALLAQIYNNLAQIFWEYTQQYDQTTRHYLHAIQMDRNNVETFIDIGLTQTAAKEYWYALNSFSIALSMIQTRNETDYLSYGLIKRNIGLIYEKSEQGLQALLSYWEAERIYNKSLPSNHEFRQIIRDDIKHVTKIVTRVHDDL
ncbi:unnamed protein product [Rotaria sordida]|uniref:Tetratricopeptide repeat protein n=2 Tax=Rotaria sordida TaxID=392033 RepID=A0A815ASJ9_9BILA|nr:unnamed protein product [Rotaria sordida]